MDNFIQPGVGRRRLLRRPCSGIEQIFGPVERITRERAALGGLVPRSHTVESFERTPMALSFPNKSRAFDATRRAVRFWGYDSAMEVAFFVTEEALKRIAPDMQSDEAGLLRAFDSKPP